MGVLDSDVYGLSFWAVAIGCVVLHFWTNRHTTKAAAPRTAAGDATVGHPSGQPHSGRAAHPLSLYAAGQPQSKATAGFRAFQQNYLTVYLLAFFAVRAAWPFLLCCACAPQAL